MGGGGSNLWNIWQTDRLIHMHGGRIKYKKPLCHGSLRQPNQYDADKFREAWDRIGCGDVSCIDGQR